MPQSLFSRLLAFSSLYLRLLLLRIQLFLSQANPVFKSETKRSILLVGDGTAEGIGDSVGNTGLSSRLDTLLKEDGSLRLSWRVISAGKLWTTAADWHPTERTLFHNTFSNRRFRDADIIILIFGMHDDPATAPELVTAIANALVRMGKHVVVTGLFNPHTPKTEQHSAVHEANRHLKQHISCAQQLNMSPGCGSLSFGADPIKVCVMGADALSEEFGFNTFNARGYRLFAADLFDDIVTAAKKVEWRYWQQRLSPSSS